MSIYPHRWVWVGMNQCGHGWVCVYGWYMGIDGYKGINGYGARCWAWIYVGISAYAGMDGHELVYARVGMWVWRAWTDMNPYVHGWVCGYGRVLCAWTYEGIGEYAGMDGHEPICAWVSVLWVWRNLCGQQLLRRSVSPHTKTFKRAFKLRYCRT